MILGFLRSFGLFLLRVPMILLGLPVVWFALDYIRPFTTDTGRQITRLPRWALWWDNAYDGVDGDARLWWDDYCRAEYDLPATAKYCRWRWTAMRNPANYFSRNICGVDVSTLTIQQVAGNIEYEGKPPYRGFFVYRGTDGKRIYPRFYAEYAFNGTHGLMIDIGWKIKLSHNGTPSDAPEKDRVKGIVAVISPWKELS